MAGLYRKSTTDRQAGIGILYFADEINVICTYYNANVIHTYYNTKTCFILMCRGDLDL